MGWMSILSIVFHLFVWINCCIGLSCWTK